VAVKRLACALLATLATPAAAQSLEVVPDSGRITVGDPVTLRVVLRQYEGDALLEQVPHPEAALADGVRLLAVDSMHAVADRRLETRATIAFYRPGKQMIPSFAIDFRRGAVILHGTMRSEPVPIEVAPLLPEGGGSTLRDIKEPGSARGPDPRLLLLAAALAGALSVWLRRRRAAAASGPVVTAEPTPVGRAADPFGLALDRLADIERARWASAGDVARHYEAVTDVLRGYLDAAEGLPARERTTSELLWALPPHLMEGGLRRRAESLLDEADLVKFARRRPDAATAAAFLAHARGLLSAWRAATPAEEALDAVR
jgi:hypothetical protein